MDKNQYFVAKDPSGLYYYYTDRDGRDYSTSFISTVNVFDLDLQRKESMKTMERLTKDKTKKWTFHRLSIGEAIEFETIVDSNLPTIRAEVLNNLSPIERKALGFG